MTLSEMLQAIYPVGQPKMPTKDQKKILNHHKGPGWVLAGPGSGKTETLALFVLKLLYVSGDPKQKERVPAKSIFVTTFTEKAARNLEDRIAKHRKLIVAQYPNLAQVDISELRIGTLHGLCNDLLQQYRAPNYQNTRLMDELEASIFLYEQVVSGEGKTALEDVTLWRCLAFLFEPVEWKPEYDNAPNKWLRAKKLLMLFDRITEGRVDLAKMQKAGGSWAIIVEMYALYQRKLEEAGRCDFANLQRLFLEFLPTAEGKKFTDGDSTSDLHDGLQWVIVDEYQDTNLLQEKIYFDLASTCKGNLLVVGDDDQAMYRFRGGSVECMVTFDKACEIFLGSKTPKKYDLADNFRSHRQIVAFYNDYIAAFASMNMPGARAPGKKPLNAAGSKGGYYEAVATLEAKKAGEVPALFADLVSDLKEQGVIVDYSQCCLLLQSTKESPRNAGPWVAALAAKGIPVYNPRNRAFLEQQEVLALLGLLISVLDPGGNNLPTYSGRDGDGIRKLTNDALTAADDMRTKNKALDTYLKASQNALMENAGEYLNLSLQELLFVLLSFEPFEDWQKDPAIRARLAQVTRLVESYASMPVPNQPNVERGRLQACTDGSGTVHKSWLNTFYHLFIGYLENITSGLNDPESETEIAPAGYFPVMTMHQAKGLEFSFVFVGHMGKKAEIGLAHKLETELAKFPNDRAKTFVQMTEIERAELDLIRQYYVAYSRAEWGLILLGSKANFRAAGAIPNGPEKTWLSERVQRL